MSQNANYNYSNVKNTLCETHVLKREKLIPTGNPACHHHSAVSITVDRSQTELRGHVHRPAVAGHEAATPACK